jgi:hypothetical protein
VTAKPLMSRRLRILLGLLGCILLVLGIPVLLVGAWQESATIVLGIFLAFPGATLLAAGIRIPEHEKRLKRRRRSNPPLWEGVTILEWDKEFDPSSIGLPLFERPLASLWSNVVVVRERGHQLRVFEIVHADLLGEGVPSTQRILESTSRSGQVVVSCVVAEVNALMPLVLVRPRLAKPVTWPDGLVDRTTELEAFDRSFRLLAADPYAATAIVDARTMEAITELDPRFSVEIGGRWILLCAPRLKSADLRTLAIQTANLMGTFPKVVGSLYRDIGSTQ